MAKHGMSQTRQYLIWQEMKKRCTKPYRKSFKNYGERGIGYCPRWEDFLLFWEDMKDGYSDEMTLERKNVLEGYNKENCEWVPKKEQSLNKSRYSSNTSGHTGIYYQQIKYGTVLRAKIINPTNGKAITKSYSLNKYTKEEAIALATTWLTGKRKEFGYKESHGHEK